MKNQNLDSFHSPLSLPAMSHSSMDYMNLNAPHSMGTTIIGVTYDSSVVLGADSRTSTGVYVVNRCSDKITQVTDNVYVCRSGSGFHDIEMIADWSAYHDYCWYAYVVIRGNTKTKEYLIEAELEGIRKATTMQELLEASAKANSKLKELDIFDSVQITLDSGPPELPRTANVLIDVIETECDYW